MAAESVVKPMNRRRCSAFTRLELTVVIVIALLLVVTLVPFQIRQKAKSLRSACVNILKQIRSAYQIWSSDRSWWPARDGVVSNEPKGVEISLPMNPVGDDVRSLILNPRKSKRLLTSSPTVQGFNARTYSGISLLSGDVLGEVSVLQITFVFETGFFARRAGDPVNRPTTKTSQIRSRLTSAASA
jgi:type II secretory pathway pseudopilin PulG